MISSADLLRLPYTPDLTEGGIAYAIRSLPYTYDRMGGSSMDRLRRIVAGVAVELAFRRHLSGQGIPFDVKGATPFTDPDRYDVSLGGHRCDIKSFLITHRGQIERMHREPAVILGAPALVPLDQHAAEGHSETDLYLFVFMSGLVTKSQEDLMKVIDAGQPYYLVHAMPAEWCRPMIWNPLGPLALKSEAEAAVTVEIGGQDKNRDFMMRVVDLPPKRRIVLEDPYYAIAYLRIKTLTAGRVGIHSQVHQETHLISPLEWGNIWVYGKEILFAGYVSREEFRRRASLIATGSRVFQYDRTRTKNLAVSVADLNSLQALFERVREWETDRAGRGL
jgi:hypothetical protein